jgi:hypothetical protein
MKYFLLKEDPSGRLTEFMTRYRGLAEAMRAARDFIAINPGCAYHVCMERNKPPTYCRLGTFGSIAGGVWR